MDIKSSLLAVFLFFSGYILRWLQNSYTKIKDAKNDLEIIKSQFQNITRLDLNWQDLSLQIRKIFHCNKKIMKRNTVFYETWLRDKTKKPDAGNFKQFLDDLSKVH